MNPEFDDIPTLIAITTNDFGVQLAMTEIGGMKEFKRILQQQIQYLIDTDLERLVNGLYRIDVAEDKATEAFADPARTASQLTDLIIERELQKVLTRQQYKNS